MREGPLGPYRRETTVASKEDGGVYAGHSEGHEGMPYDVEPGEYAIWLPHDCDEWIIATGSREEVLTKGRQFVEAVQAALEVIEKGAE